MRKAEALAGIEIREARAGDGEACAALWVEFGRALVERRPDVFRVPALDGLAEWFEGEVAAAGTDDLRLVAERDRAVVALANASFRAPAVTAGVTLIAANVDPVVLLEDIVVTERLRRRGVGALLVRHVEDWGRSRGAKTLSLSSDADGPARRFYERAGYRQVSAGYARPL